MFSDGDEIVFPCHKNELVTWLKGIKDKPTRQVLKDDPENNRDFLEDNEMDIGNENKTTDEEMILRFGHEDDYNPTFGLYNNRQNCRALPVDAPHDLFGNVARYEEDNTCVDTVAHIQAPITTNCQSYTYLLKDTPDRGNLINATYRSITAGKDYTEYGKTLCEETGEYKTWCEDPEKLQDWYEETGKGCPGYFGYDKSWGVKGTWEYCYPYGMCLFGMSLQLPWKKIYDSGGGERYLADFTAQYLEEYSGAIEPFTNVLSDYDHTKNLRLFPFPLTPGDMPEKRPEVERMFRSATFMDNDYQHVWDITHYTYSTDLGHYSTYGFLHADDYKRKFRFYSYKTDECILTLDMMPVREIKKVFGTLDNYTSIQETIKNIDFDKTIPIDLEKKLFGTDLGTNLSFYLSNAVPQWEENTEHDCTNRRYVLCTSAGVLYGVLIGCILDTFTQTREEFDTKFAVSWCKKYKDMENQVDLIHEIKLTFYTGKFKWEKNGVRRTEKLSARCGIAYDYEDINESGIVEDRVSSVNARINLENYKDYPKANLTIENESIVNERPHRYERIKEYSKNYNGTCYPFDGTYDIYTLGEAVEKLINDHYEDGSDDQLLVYLYERPDMIEKEVKK